MDAWVEPSTAPKCRERIRARGRMACWDYVLRLLGETGKHFAKITRERNAVDDARHAMAENLITGESEFFQRLADLAHHGVHAFTEDRLDTSTFDNTGKRRTNIVRINFAHLREQATSGGYIDFAVFDANASSGTDQARAEVLSSLTQRTRASGRKIDMAALIYEEHGSIRTYGDQAVVEYLSQRGVPHWTNTIDI